MSKYLYNFDSTLRYFLGVYLIILTIGIFIGLIFVRENTGMSSEGVIERFNGTEEVDELSFEQEYPISVHELLMTTHNHIIGFSFIFLSIGSIFYFNSLIKGFWKKFLMIEPLFSTLITFGSIWGIRFINEYFIALMIISAVVMYASYFIMAGVSFYDLLVKPIVIKKF